MGRRWECIQCGSTNLRRPHFRGEDWDYVWKLKLPVRCRSCLKRQYVFLPRAIRIWLL
jgi:hypothetical protein